MRRVRQVLFKPLAFLALLIAAALFLVNTGVADHSHTTKPFFGVKVNGGAVTHSKHMNHNVLTLSDDFQVPDTPDPHWQVVDSKGNVYQLQKLAIKGDKINNSITLTDYVRDVAKVQIWCSFAETLLGEAPFDAPVK